MVIQGDTANPLNTNIPVWMEHLCGTDSSVSAFFSDSRPIAIGATVATGLACILIIVSSTTDNSAPKDVGK